MIWQAWIKNLLHFFVVRKIVSDFAATAIVLFHANGQSLDAAQKQPAFERRQDGSGTFLNERKLLRLLRLGADHNTSQPIAVTIKKFRSRVDNHVSAEFNRMLKIWRHESVVDDHLNPMPMAEFADGTEIAKLHQRIGWCLQK